MKVYAIIKDSSGEWEEDFEVTSNETAEEEIKGVVDYFNEKRRSHELEREFVKIIN